MSIVRRITKIGGSLGIIVPRDLVEAMGVTSGSKVRLSLVGNQMVVEPQTDTMSEASFRRSLATVMRRYAPAMQALADYDQGK